MAEKLLLHMQYELEQMGVAIPYDRIAHRLHPGSSAGAIQLLLGWTRERLVAEGHLVPPIPGSQNNPTVRGLARRETNLGGNLRLTRPVSFDEPFEDSESSLPDAVNLKPRKSQHADGTAKGADVSLRGAAPEGKTTDARPTRKRQRDVSSTATAQNTNTTTGRVSNLGSMTLDS
jgi:hypothetical protein